MRTTVSRVFKLISLVVSVDVKHHVYLPPRHHPGARISCPTQVHGLGPPWTWVVLVVIKGSISSNKLRVAHYLCWTYVAQPVTNDRLTQRGPDVEQWPSRASHSSVTYHLSRLLKLRATLLVLQSNRRASELCRSCVWKRWMDLGYRH